MTHLKHFQKERNTHVWHQQSLESKTMGDAQDSAHSGILSFEFYKPHLQCWWSQVFRIQEQIHLLPNQRFSQHLKLHLHWSCCHQSRHQGRMMLYLDFEISNSFSGVIRPPSSSAAPTKQNLVTKFSSVEQTVNCVHSDCECTKQFNLQLTHMTYLQKLGYWRLHINASYGAQGPKLISVTNRLPLL